MCNLLIRLWRFNKQRRDLEGVGHKVLTDSLRSKADERVIRTVYHEVPPRVEYASSGQGASMRPIIKARELWGMNHKANTGKTE